MSIKSLTKHFHHSTQLIWSHLCQQSSIQLTLKSRLGPKCYCYQLLFKLPPLKWPKLAQSFLIHQQPWAFSSAPWPRHTKDIKASVANNVVSIFILGLSKMQQILWQNQPLYIALYRNLRSTTSIDIQACSHSSCFHNLAIFRALCYLHFPRKPCQFQTQLQKFIKKNLCEWRFVRCLLPPSTAFCEACSLKEQKDRARWKRRRDKGWQAD